MTNKFKHTAFLLFIAFCAHGIVINEFAASNRTSLRVNSGFPDWIELFNPSDSTVDLGGFSISDDPLDPFRYTFPTFFLEPYSYLILLATDDSIGVGDMIILNFKLDADGEFIGLYDPFGSVVDSIDFGPQKPDITTGHPREDLDLWTMFLTPTPGAPNDTISGWGFSGEPVISPSSRFFISPLNANIFGPNSRYSIDLSDPWITGVPFSTPIHIDTTSVLRARLKEPGMLPGNVVAATYFLEPLPNLPVFSITTDPRNLWNDTIGICVVGLDTLNPNYSQHGGDWERSARLQLIDLTYGIVFDEPGQIRVQGGGDRSRSIKAFRIKFDDSPLETQVLPAIERDRYTWLILRAGGNDGTSRIRTCLSQLLGIRSGTAVSGFRAVRLYVNGELFGLYNLREYIDEEFAREHFGDGDYDVMDYYNARSGSDSAWWATVDFFETRDLSIDTVFEQAMSLIDEWNFVNYQIINIYAGNTDWPAKNETRLRPRRDYGEWRWIIWDTDFGFGCFPTCYSPIDHNTLAWAIRPVAMPELNPNPFMNPEGQLWAVAILRSSMENDGFKKDFINRFADLLNTQLSADSVISRIDSLALANEDTENDEYEHHGWWIGDWYNSMVFLRDFAMVRPAFVRGHIIECFDLDSTAFVSIAPTIGGKIAINTLPAFRDGFEGLYFAGIPVKLRALADPGYRFAEWGDFTLPDSANIEVDPAIGLTLTPIFVIDTSFDGLCINELMALNDTTICDSIGEYDDWVELYFEGYSTINLRGCGFSDNPAEPFRYLFDDDLFMSPGDYILIWCDNDPEQGVEHTNFRLSAAGEWIGIYSPASSGGSLLDSMSFPMLEPIFPTEGFATAATQYVSCLILHRSLRMTTL